MKISLINIRLLGLVFLLIFISSRAYSLPTMLDAFDMSPFQTLDLGKHCKTLFGAEAEVIHPTKLAADTECVSGDDTYPLTVMDFEAACNLQYGELSGAVLLDLGIGGWHCADWTKVNHKVTPVVIIARDKLDDLNAASMGVTNVGRVMSATRKWYGYGMDLYGNRTFQVVQPIVVMSQYTSDQWKEYSCRTASKRYRPPECDPSFAEADGTRYLMYENALDEVVPYFSDAAAQPILTYVSVFIYAGNDADAFWLGAAGMYVNPDEHLTGVFYNVQPPNLATCDGSDPYCGIYAVGHELGHNFGLGHSCELYSPPLCWDSLMQNPSRNFERAILLPEEQLLLSQSSFLGSGFSTTIQSESQVWDAGVVESEHGGYTGAGYLNTRNVLGTSAYAWMIVPKSGWYQIDVRYAHKVEDRAQGIEVNGVRVLNSVAFLRTANWDQWQDERFTVKLEEGFNDIRFISLADGGAPNLDRVVVSDTDLLELQAEHQWWDRGTVDTEHEGFTGSGFLNTQNKILTGIDWKVPANGHGWYELTVRYAHQISDRPQAIYVNDKLAVESVPFLKTGSFEHWQEQSFLVTLDNGINNVRMESLTAGGAPNIDRMIVKPLEVLVLQAEDQSWDKGSVDSRHAGYNGSGYLNTQNKIGTSVYWETDIPETGTYEIAVRYSHGLDDRAQAIYVNGDKVVESVPFFATGAWGLWWDEHFTLELKAGPNVIKMVSLTSGGAPDLDQMQIKALGR